jgi:hypothetical protein
MTPKSKEEQIAWIAVAAIAGIANYLSRVVNEPRKFVFLHMVANLLSACIAGYVVLNLGLAYGLSNEMVGALSGVSGWMGPKLLDEAGRVMAAMLPELMARGKVAMYMMVKPDHVPYTEPVKPAQQPLTPAIQQHLAPQIQDKPIQPIVTNTAPTTQTTTEGLSDRELRKARLQAERENKV